MKTLLTGSRVYGTPRPDSDLDMVVLVENMDEMVLLGKMSDTQIAHKQIARDIQYNGSSFRYGKMNIIAVYQDEDTFEAWKKGTEFLKQIAPVTHEIACMVFDTMFKAVKAGKNVARQTPEPPF